MLQDSDDLMSIVVLESGAAWPSWLTEYQRLAPNSVVIAQASTESPELFQARVLRRLEEPTLHDPASRVRVGVLVASDDPGQQRRALRQNVAQGLLKAMAKVDDGELVLAGESDELNHSRHELFALAGELCKELGGRRINVRVRFTSAKSGVMRSISAATPDPPSVASKR